MSNVHHRCTLARLRPELAAQHPSIPSRTWHLVLSRNPLALSPQAEPGFVWVKVDGRRRKLPAAYFKFARPGERPPECPACGRAAGPLRLASAGPSGSSGRVQVSVSQM